MKRHETFLPAGQGVVEYAAWSTDVLRKALLKLLVLVALSPSAGAAEASPSEAYLAYHAALKSGFSESAIWPHATAAARAEFERKFPPELRGRAFYMMKTTSPQTVRVVQERVDGDSATLTVRPDGGEKRMVATATLRREDGAWKVEKVVWQQD